MFRSAGKNQRREGGGSGLGLLCIKIRCAHFKSTSGSYNRVGGGSLFWFRLPGVCCPPPGQATHSAAKAVESFKATDNPETQPLKKVLVVEDSVCVLKAIKRGKQCDYFVCLSTGRRTAYCAGSLLTPAYAQPYTCSTHQRRVRGTHC